MGFLTGPSRLRAKGRPALRFWAALLPAAALLLTSLPAFANTPTVKDMSYRYQDSNLLVSLSVADAFNRPDLKEAIMSTRQVTITFTVELLKHRPGWIPKVMVRRKLSKIVQYDTLTHQFALETQLDGESLDKRVVETWDEMVKYAEAATDIKMTSVANMSPAETYTVRGQIHLLNDFALWIIPWDIQTPWATMTLSTP
jgi:hypothetical protein